MNILKLPNIFQLSKRIYYNTLMASCQKMLFMQPSTKSYSSLSISLDSNKNKLLQSQHSVISQECGMKTKGKVQRRCKDCVLYWRGGRLYNKCKTLPRHNQVSLLPPPKTTWILSNASMSPRRPW